MPLEQRQQQLLDAAIEVIVRDGYEKVSIDAIAREVGVTRPVVYGAYNGLGPLLQALLDRQQARALSQLAEVMPDGADPRAPEEFILSTVTGLIDKVTGDPLTWRPILMDHAGLPREVSDRIAGDRARLRGQIMELLRAGFGERAGRAVDYEMAAHAVLALLEHFGGLLLRDPEHFPPERIMRSLRGLLAAMR